MNNAALERGPSRDRAASGHYLLRLHKAVVFRRYAELRGGSVAIALAPIDERGVGGAQPCGGLDQRVENWLQVEGRTADDLQHVAGRSLVLERLLKITGARAQFAQKPRVLHGDHGLRGEILQQCDLLVGERIDRKS